MLDAQFDGCAVVAVFFADFVFEVAGAGEVEVGGVFEEEGEFWWVDVDLAAVHEFGFLDAAAGREVFLGDFLHEAVEFCGTDALVAF